MSHLTHTGSEEFTDLINKKLISGYVLIIQCKIKFWILCLTPKWNACVRKNVIKSVHQKLGGEPKTVIFSDLKAMGTQITG